MSANKLHTQRTCPLAERIVLTHTGLPSADFGTVNLHPAGQLTWTAVRLYHYHTHSHQTFFALRIARNTLMIQLRDLSILVQCQWLFAVNFISTW